MPGRLSAGRARRWRGRRANGTRDGDNLMNSIDDGAAWLLNRREIPTYSMHLAGTNSLPNTPVPDLIRDLAVATAAEATDQARDAPGVGGAAKVRGRWYETPWQPVGPP